MMKILQIRYRLYRKLINHVKNILLFLINVRYRYLRRVRFRFLRLLFFFVWRLWVGEVVGFDKIKMNEAAVVVSNHLSYFDFWILSSILRKQTVFVAVRDLTCRAHVGWTLKLNTMIYVDREKPGFKFFKEIIWYLKEQKRLVVMYPEGTRSRTGKMLMPKLGFVKLAIKAGVPIIPVAMRGTYEILPPNKHLPKLKKCDVFIGDKIYITPENEKFSDIFFKEGACHPHYKQLDDSKLYKIAFRIMNEIRKMAGQEWDESVDMIDLDESKNKFDASKKNQTETLPNEQCGVF